MKIWLIDMMINAVVIGVSNRLSHEVDVFPGSLLCSEKPFV